MAKTVKCTHCDKMFETNANMRRHRTQVHKIHRKLIAYPIEIGSKLVQDEDGNMILGGVYIPENYDLVSISHDKHYMRHNNENFNVHIAFLIQKESESDKNKEIKK